MDIAPYIANLLKQQDEVYLTGFGTFFKQRTEGFFDDSSGVFVPPSYVIAFKLGGHEDNKLAEYISFERNLSLSSSEYFIDQFSASLKKDAQTAPVALSGLGKLYKENDEYFLKAEDGEFQDLSFFGLQPVHEIDFEKAHQLTEDHQQTFEDEAEVENEKQGKIESKEETPQAKSEETIVGTPDEALSSVPEIAYEELPEPEIIQPQEESTPQEETLVIETPVEKTPSYSETTSDLNPAEPIVEIRDLVYTLGEKSKKPPVEKEPFEQQEYSDDNGSSGGWWKKLLLGLLILLIIIVGIYLIYPQAFDSLKTLFPPKTEVQKPATATLKDTLASAEDSLRKADEVYDKLKQVGLEPEKAKDTLVQTVTDEKLNSNPVTTYEIIVASFDTNAGAEKYVGQMKKKGFDAHIVTQAPGNRVKVSLASFTSRDSARTELSRFIKNINKESWIFTNKPNN